ncbi:hypothetical protein C1752_06189 [Acaryochloris thomasi RCC1774]|uniref:Uncharacterized protein n=1 Tax=Acaryochloris thomasi RCC1774 TaxID=1764569 RepID=A0A2W1JC60_9CYAN|nr:hypothetical protein [Acaryochloris thomasi]PZD71569.1 hypothetical protein C1752_06189 [Acaryochloris thomasi RCC1774]
MSVSNPANDNRAVRRSNPQEVEPGEAMPWEQEGEFEIEAVIMSQSNGELLVKTNSGGQPTHLTIAGYLPGKVTSQTWRLACLRESGQLELLDGEPISQ